MSCTAGPLVESSVGCPGRLMFGCRKRRNRSTDLHSTGSVTYFSGCWETPEPLEGVDANWMYCYCCPEKAVSVGEAAASFVSLNKPSSLAHWLKHRVLSQRGAGRDDVNSALTCLFSLSDGKLILQVSEKGGRKACGFRGTACKPQPHYVLVRFSELWSPCSFCCYFSQSS